MENPTFDFYLTESYKLPSGAQVPEIKIEQKLIYEFLNSKENVYFQRFYVFEDDFVVLEETCDGKTTLKSNKKINVDADLNVTFTN